MARNGEWVMKVRWGRPTMSYGATRKQKHEGRMGLALSKERVRKAESLTDGDWVCELIKKRVIYREAYTANT